MKLSGIKIVEKAVKTLMVSFIFWPLMEVLRMTISELASLSLLILLRRCLT